MRRETPVHQRVFNKLYPKPQANVDPSSWSSFVRHCLVKEVRHEIQHYYGCPPETLAQRYPGFDYNCPRIRIRFSRYPHHKRLFQALDELTLTESEISELCCWEGSLAAKQKFERDHGVTITEPYSEEIPHWDDSDEVLRRQALAAAREAQHTAATEAQSTAPALANSFDGAADDRRQDNDLSGTNQSLTPVTLSTEPYALPTSAQMLPPQDRRVVRDRLTARQARSQSMSSLANRSTHSLYRPITLLTPPSSTPTLASETISANAVQITVPPMAAAAVATTAATTSNAPATVIASSPAVPTNPLAAMLAAAAVSRATPASPTSYTPAQSPPLSTPLLPTRPSREELARTIAALLNSPHASEVATLLEDFFKDIDDGASNERSMFRNFLQQLRG